MKKWIIHIIIPTTIEQSLPMTIKTEPVTFGLASVCIYIAKYHHQSKNVIFQKFMCVAVSVLLLNKK